MPDPLSTAITVLALGIWAAGLRMAFLRHGREAELGEIADQVQEADPAMPQDDPIELDFEFYNRSS